MKNKIKTFRDYLMTRLAALVYRYKPEALDNMVRKEVDKLASDLAIQMSMAYLNRERILHCAACPQRHGLRRKQITHKGELREVYVCPNHQNAFAEPGALVGAAQKEAAR